MNTRQRDEAYWTDAFRAFYINGDYGRYDDAHARFTEEFPEYREHVKRTSKHVMDAVMRKAVQGVKKGFRQADHEEREAAPRPQHLRDAFLPFHVDVPPMSQSVNAFDGQGRLSMLNASPKQQIRHQRHEKQRLHEGVVYREAMERRQQEFLKEIEDLLPDVPMVGDLALREIVAILKERARSVDRDDEDTTTTAPPPV